MKMQEVLIGDRSTINTDVEDIDEVVAIAYGSMTKRAITGNATSVGADVIENQIAISPLSSIRGTAPRVNILSKNPIY